MNKLVVLCALFVAVIARDAYVCEVLLPGFDDAVAQPLMTLGGRTFDLTDNFNLVSFDSMYAPSGDVEGRTAVRNNVNFPLGQYSIGYELRTSPVTGVDNSLPHAFIVGHDAVWNGGSVHPDGTGWPQAGARETFFVGGAFTGPSYLAEYRSATSCQTAGCLDSTFDNAQAYYTALSNAWAAVPANANAVFEYGGVTITCPNTAGLNWVVDVTGAQISATTYWALVNCNEESQIVFNIRGSGEVFFSGDNLRHRQEKVLYNVIGSGRSVRVITEVRGSILAPTAQYNQPAQGVVKGLVFVGNAVQVHQINRLTCERPATVPSDHLCPGFETDCSGLNAQVGGSSFTFRDFNAISFNDFTAASGDVEGRLAVRNNVYIGSGYSIGYELRTVNNAPDAHLSYSLIAGGNVNWTSGEIFPVGNGIPSSSQREDMYVGGEFNGADNLAGRRTGGPCGSAGCLNSVFDAAYSCYSGYSTYAAGKTDNVNKVFQYTGLFLSCNDNTATEYVVSLTPAELNSFTYVVTDNCNFQSYWIVNVRGTGDVTLTGDSWPTIPGATVYNVIGERTVNVYSTSLTGHLLAPDATLNQAGGVIIGKVVAANIVASLQINKQNTCPVSTTVQLRIVAAAAAQQGQSTVTVFGASAFRVGDVTTLGTITAINGNEVTFSEVLGRPVSAGAFVGYASVASDSGRAYVASPEEDSSASVAGVAIAALIVSALVL